MDYIQIYENNILTILINTSLLHYILLIPQFSWYIGLCEDPPVANIYVNQGSHYISIAELGIFLLIKSCHPLHTHPLL